MIFQIYSKFLPTCSKDSKHSIFVTWFSPTYTCRGVMKTLYCKTFKIDFDDRFPRPRLRRNAEGVRILSLTLITDDQMQFSDSLTLHKNADFYNPLTISNFLENLQ